MILRTQEDFRRYEESNGFLSHNHIHIRSVSPEGARVSAEVRPESRNAAGFVHGGLLMLLVDVAASQAAMADDGQYVTQNTFVSFLSNVKEGTLTAESETVKRGRRTALIRVRVFSEERKLLADATVTMMRTN